MEVKKGEEKIVYSRGKCAKDLSVYLEVVELVEWDKGKEDEETI